MLLTDPAFIRRLESLYLLSRKVLGGTLQADRKSTKKGSGITFADYSEYSFGDDYRAIDWGVYGRFEELVIKLFELEEDVNVYILLDGSHSMSRKFDYARQLAAALGYIALNNLDKIVLYGLSDDIDMLLEPSHGRGKILPFLKALEDATVFGRDTDFTTCARAFQVRHRRRGVVLVVSDFLFPGGFDDGLKYLLWNRHDVFCLQVQDDFDRRCDWKGDVELECVESRKRLRVTITPAEAARYEAAVKDWNDSLATFCARNRIGLAPTDPRVPFEKVIQEILRRGGLVA